MKLEATQSSRANTSESTPPTSSSSSSANLFSSPPSNRQPIEMRREGLAFSRWHLYMKAPIWRALMAIGMKFHHFAAPKPPRPNFKIIIPSRLSRRGGRFKLVFYCPDSYLHEPDDDDYRYPVVVNFHGGGFTLGTGTDDARWAASVVENTQAVFVSVEYRLAPEYPFSVGVEDGTDALMYLASHAEELRLDPHRMALSGFSAGGNFAFTVPLMLYDLQHDMGKRTFLETTQSPSRPSSSHQENPSTLSLPPQSHPNSSTLSLPSTHLMRSHSSASASSILKLSNLQPTALEIHHEIPSLTLKCIISFYPPTDFRTPRAEKRATNPHPEMNLPPMLTNLFDSAYLNSAASLDLSDPYLSPAAASDGLLKDAYPEDIVMYTCEYDMLNREGVEFGNRLSSHPISKHLHGGLIKGVPHAFDKKPNPLSFPTAADRCYSEATAELRRVFGGRTSVDERRVLDQSLNVERFEREEEGDTLIGEGDDGHVDGEGWEDGAGEGTTRRERRGTISAFRDRWKVNQEPPPQSPGGDGDDGERRKSEKYTGDLPRIIEPTSSREESSLL